MVNPTTTRGPSDYHQGVRLERRDRGAGSRIDDWLRPLPPGPSLRRWGPPPGLSAAAPRSTSPSRKRGASWVHWSEKKFYGAPTPLDRRTNHRLAEPLSQVAQGLGEPESQGLGLFTLRLQSPH